MEAEISNRDPIVQSKVMEALAKGGSSALDVVTAVVSSSTKVSCPTLASSEGAFTVIEDLVEDPNKLESAQITGVGGFIPDPKPPYQHSPIPATITQHFPSSSSCGAQEGALEHGEDFKVVSNRKKKKGKSNQKAPPSKGR